LEGRAFPQVDLLLLALQRSQQGPRLGLAHAPIDIFLDSRSRRLALLTRLPSGFAAPQLAFFFLAAGLWYRRRLFAILSRFGA
jgi:hypothetical protein